MAPRRAADAAIWGPSAALGATLLLCIASASLVAANMPRHAHPQHPQHPNHQVPPVQAPPTPTWCKTEPYAPDLRTTTMYRGGPSYKVYHNLLFHNMKWYALMDAKANNSQFENGISVNNGAIQLPVADPAAFLGTLKACYIPGAALMMDFPFPAFPDNLGHFAEVVLPAFSVLHSTDWRDHLDGGIKHVTHVVTSNLHKPLMDWYSESLLLTLSAGVASLVEFPPPIDATDLEKYDKKGWVIFQNVIVPQDRYTHPKSLTGFTLNEVGDSWKGSGSDRFVMANWKVGFTSHRDAYEFRRKAYLRHRWPAAANWTPGEPPAIPPVITLLQYPEDYPEIVNSAELVAVLREVAATVGWKVRVTSLTMEAPFVSHMAVMSQTGLLVARHGPLLSNSVMLPPGAAVLELLPYKWEWQAISRIYYNMTQSTGGIHHFAWRPTDPKWCDYKEGKDRRYSVWTAEECTGRECLLVHARAGLIVDLQHIKELLLERLPRVIAGESVDAVRLPWPKAD